VKERRVPPNCQNGVLLLFSVGDPDPHVFGPPVSRSISQMYGSGSRSLSFLIKVLSGLKKCLQNSSNKMNFKTEDNVPADKL
jgi:hypothetical protein